MPKTLTIQNKFTRGLITEAHGLDFPEDACTETSNCVFTLIGEVVRRPGIDYEDNFLNEQIGNQGAVNTFRWKNAGGDGATEILVVQEGGTLYFYLSSQSTLNNPVSRQLITSTVSLNSFLAFNNPTSVHSECQFAAGNGYLFVFNPNCDPFFCTYNPSTGQVTATLITVQIRDFLGFYPESATSNLPVTFRPIALTNEHNYNLQNQGWTGNPKWTASSANGLNQLTGTGPGNAIELGSGSFTITTLNAVTGVTAGQSITILQNLSGQFLNVATNTHSPWTNTLIGSGTVTSYTSPTMVINIASTSQFGNQPGIIIQASPLTNNWTTITPGNISNTINTWFSDVGNYPSNADIWYLYKDVNNIYNPTTTFSNVVQPNSPAPQGHFILNAFLQGRQAVSGVVGLTDVSTIIRPSTGTWFQGRVWYAGVNNTQQAVGDEQTYTWSENIYFSQQITPGDSTSFGNCYQQNDPTDENFFDILPTDGGVIIIPGTGAIYKLFAVQNGVLVFAQNGVWFITGNQGLGFTATSYSINKISAIQCISGTSFIDVMGLPYFWNEEGIYKVSTVANIPYGQGGLNVEPITVGTILSFYNQIPKDSKLYARGDYDPVGYVIKWVYKTTQETGIGDRYKYDGVLNLNIFNRAFYPYTISSNASTPYVNGLFYLNYPNSSNGLIPQFKYVAVQGGSLAFAEENDDTYVDWSGQNFVSSFTTGYSLQGKGVMKHQPTYVYVYSRNTVPFAYTIQGVWDYAVNPNSGRYSSQETVINGLGQPNFGNIFRRHKVRGHGMSLQLNFTSVQGQPFDFLGWTTIHQIDGGV